MIVPLFFSHGVFLVPLLFITSLIMMMIIDYDDDDDTMRMLYAIP